VPAAGTACIGTFALTPASKEGRASHGGHKFGLVGHPEVQAETQTEFARGVCIFAPAKLTRYPKDRKF